MCAAAESFKQLMMQHYKQVFNTETSRFLLIRFKQHYN